MTFMLKNVKKNTVYEDINVCVYVYVHICLYINRHIEHAGIYDHYIKIV